MSKAIFFILMLVSTSLFASTEFSHSDPIASVILGVTLILFFAVIGRYLARLFNQSSVLGELLMGVLIGNLFYFFGVELFVILREGPAMFTIVGKLLSGDSIQDAVSQAISNPKSAALITNALRGPNGLELLKVSYIVDIFSRYGVIFLLFMVGLDSSIDELKHTGSESVKVALIGVIAPFLLGLIVALLLMPSMNFKTHIFIGATLCATSLGITARVLTEMGKIETREARTILGAAMLDDILGLILLAIVSSVIITGTVDVREIIKIITLAILFFTTAIMLGPIILEASIKFLDSMVLWESKLFISFLFVMILAWLASLVDLATIIGAFAAGLILHDGYFKPSNKRGLHLFTIKNLIAPLELILAPLFFILIGIQVKLETFLDWHVLMLATGLLFAAIVGKLLSGLGGRAEDNRLVIGLGMLPRGEVGLVFASIGRTLNVITDEVFSAIVMMVIITTVIAPPLIKLKFKE